LNSKKGDQRPAISDQEPGSLKINHARMIATGDQISAIRNRIPSTTDFLGISFGLRARSLLRAIYVFHDAQAHSVQHLRQVVDCQKS
jgi:hypothetical protein